MPAPRPGSAQLQSELDLSSQRWTRRKLLSPRLTLSPLPLGARPREVRNVRRLDLVEASPGPSRAGGSVPCRFCSARGVRASSLKTSA